MIEDFKESESSEDSIPGEGDEKMIGLGGEFGGSRMITDPISWSPSEIVWMTADPTEGDWEGTNEGLMMKGRVLEGVDEGEEPTI